MRRENFQVVDRDCQYCKTTTFCKAPNFQHFYCCWNFAATHSSLSCELPNTLRKLFISAKFPHQKTRWSYSILCSASKWRCYTLYMQKTNKQTKKTIEKTKNNFFFLEIQKLLPSWYYSSRIMQYFFRWTKTKIEKMCL